MNYFELFSLPVSFTTDEAALKSKYFELQRQYHPDKIGLEGAQKSMELNQAYDTLGDPLKRAQHFLALHDIDVGHDDSRIKPGMELLEEMMEKREAVMELESADAATALLAKAAGEYETELAKFTQFAEKLAKTSPRLRGDGGGKRLKSDQSLPPIPPASGGVEFCAAQSLLRLQYVTKWQAEIKQQMKRFQS